MDMPVIDVAERTGNLRHHLRDATAAAHDLLDDTMRAASGWSERADYIRFLQLQLGARLSVEAWFDFAVPAELRPPRQCALIAADLAALGVRPMMPGASGWFDLGVSDHASEAQALGAAWVLAGSALGNKGILREMKRAARESQDGEWPHLFLGDPGMLEFWHGLRRRIERPASANDVAAASRSATAVFDHFIAFAAA
jgi:heme oxygenase